jgi:sensor c-di-GMP phosphodiesterase-like protein
MELTRLRQAGVTIALDDFGTGYSSLAWLSRIPIDEVKIDRSSITPLVQDSRTRLLVQGFVRMFQELGLRVVAEGIETIDQRDALLAKGWAIGQGWLFGRPGPPEALLGEALLPSGKGASPDRPRVASFGPSASEG